MPFLCSVCLSGAKVQELVNNILHEVTKLNMKVVGIAICKHSLICIYSNAIPNVHVLDSQLMEVELAAH